MRLYLEKAAQSCSGITDSHNRAALHCVPAALDVPLRPTFLHILPALSLRLTQGSINPTGAEKKLNVIHPPVYCCPIRQESSRNSQHVPAWQTRVCVCVCWGGAVQGCYENILLFPCTFPVMMCGEASGWLPLACTNSCDAV